MEVWVNPTCSKCLGALAAMDTAGVTYTVRRYLDDPPTATELDEVLGRLGLQPWDVARTREPVAKQLGLPELPRDAENRHRWISALVANPILIQRPIITAEDGTTVIGRDADSVDRVIDAER